MRTGMEAKFHPVWIGVSDVISTVAAESDAGALTCRYRASEASVGCEGEAIFPGEKEIYAVR
jgi:hypothetical protein